jgi:hypothetical protein
LADDHALTLIPMVLIADSVKDRCVLSGPAGLQQRAGILGTSLGMTRASQGRDGRGLQVLEGMAMMG